MAALNDLFGGAPAPASKPLPCLPPIGHYPARKIPFAVPPPPKFGQRRVRVVDSFAGGGGASNGIECALEALKAAGLLPDEANPASLTPRACEGARSRNRVTSQR